MGSEDRAPTALAYAWRDALNARDADAFGRLFGVAAEFVDVEHRTPDGQAPRVLRGRDEIVAVAVDWFARTPAFRYEILDVVGDERRAAKRWRYVVGAIDVEGVTWLDCEGGRIQRALVLFDAVPLLRAGG